MKGTHGRGAPPEREQGRWGANALYLACLAATAAALLCLLSAGAAQRAAAQETTAQEATGPESGGAQETTDGVEGQPGPGKIVGGKPVPNSKYPFMASLQNDRERTAPRRDHFCGGTLISPYHVPTAAHCAEALGENPQQSLVPLVDFRVVVGGATLNGDDGRVRKVSSMSQVFLHPRYADSPAYDVAVLTLDRPVAGIEPVRLATTGTDAAERPDRRAIVAGMDALLSEPEASEDGFGGDASPREGPPLVRLRADPGRAGVEGARAELVKLARLRELGLPDDLFAGTAPKVVRAYRGRAASESPNSLRAHPPAVRYALLAALCFSREREVTDGLVEVLLQVVHNIGTRSERKVEKILFYDIQNGPVRGPSVARTETPDKKQRRRPTLRYRK